MRSSPSRVAVDTSVLINVFTGGANGEAAWLPHSKWVLSAAAAGHHELVVPAIVVAEVAGKGLVRGDQLQRSERQRRISAVMEWIHRGRHMIVEIDERCARKAADLAVAHHMRGADACVVAAATIAGCSTLYSWDKGHTKLGSEIDSLVVREPHRLPTEQDALHV